MDQTNRVFPKNDVTQALPFGDAVREATLKGAALSDVLTSVADAKPSSLMDATREARKFAREYAAA